MGPVRAGANTSWHTAVKRGTGPVHGPALSHPGLPRKEDSVSALPICGRDGTVLRLALLEYQDRTLAVRNSVYFYCAFGIRRTVLSTGCLGSAHRSVIPAAGAVSSAILAPAFQPLALGRFDDGSSHLRLRCP
jgi:hypothetical protein